MATATPPYGTEALDPQWAATLREMDETATSPNFVIPRQVDPLSGPLHLIEPVPGLFEPTTTLEPFPPPGLFEPFPPPRPPGWAEPRAAGDLFAPAIAPDPFRPDGVEPSAAGRGAADGMARTLDGDTTPHGLPMPALASGAPEAGGAAVVDGAVEEARVVGSVGGAGRTAVVGGHADGTAFPGGADAAPFGAAAAANGSGDAGLGSVARTGVVPSGIPSSDDSGDPAPGAALTAAPPTGTGAVEPDPVGVGPAEPPLDGDRAEPPLDGDRAQPPRDGDRTQPPTAAVGAPSPRPRPAPARSLPPAAGPSTTATPVPWLPLPEVPAPAPPPPATAVVVREPAPSPVQPVRADAPAPPGPRGDRWPRRAGRAVLDLVGGTAAARELTDLASRTQLPVTTGRRIAVVAPRGGAGRSTVAALLALVYAARRADHVLVADAEPALGSLAWRLDAEPDGDPAALGPRLLAARSGTIDDVAALLPAGPAGLHVLPGGTGATAEITRALSRFFAITVIDGGGPPARDVHAAVLVTPATADGVRTSAAVLRRWRGGAVVAVVDRDRGTHPPLADLDIFDVPVVHLPHDRHLAAGAAIRPGRLAAATRREATRLAGLALEAALRDTS